MRMISMNYWKGQYYVEVCLIFEKSVLYKIIHTWKLNIAELMDWAKYLITSHLSKEYDKEIMNLKA